MGAPQSLWGIGAGVPLNAMVCGGGVPQILWGCMVGVPQKFCDGGHMDPPEMLWWGSP